MRRLAAPLIAFLCCSAGACFGSENAFYGDVPGVDADGGASPQDTDREDAGTAGAADAGAPTGGVGGAGGSGGTGGIPATGGTGGIPATGGTGGVPVVDAGVADAGSVDAGGSFFGDCGAPGAYEPLIARPGETCYEFRTHGVSAPGDTTPFTVPTGESYHELYFDVPWGPGDVMTRLGSNFDNLQLLHHYHVFAASPGQANGTVVQNVTGTVIGSNATLIGAWAVGGCNSELPRDVGLQLPSSGSILILWHMYNSTGAPQPEASTVQICTVPAGSRPHVGDVTFLGTEDLGGLGGIPTGSQSYSSTCLNDSGDDITVFAFMPYMHLLGVSMRTDLDRAGGGVETVFDQPFAFDYQIAYGANPLVVVYPGDSLTTTCSFFNDTGANVAYGPSVNQEMCYQFTFAYPAGALRNGVPSLIGATNTCW